ncbi:small ubiquitin-related modifier-like [Ischnura elegans]|uniref:small ubiquitin-related modifier-like n=1 Tax=Ischnura elegans TaxID=197161 RepID=UPI001ED89C51|nr:small ubiquitin-related modifier-like [Ischnura elegans]
MHKGSEADAAVAETNSQHILLKLISDDGIETHMQIKTAVTMSRLKEVYCSHVGVGADRLIFVFKGREINNIHTASQAGMKNEDVIEVYGLQERRWIH